MWLCFGVKTSYSILFLFIKHFDIAQDEIRDTSSFYVSRPKVLIVRSFCNNFTFLLVA